MNRVTVLALLLLVSGCLAPNEGDTPAPSPAPEGPTDFENGTHPMPAVLATGCFETQAEFPNDPSDFEGGIPPGFTLVLDELGMARVVAVSRSCAIDHSTGEVVFAFVLLEAPEAVRRPGADHGGLLSAWSDADALAAAFKGWNITTAQGRAIEIEVTRAGEAAESRTRADPDFVLTVQAGGSAVAAPFGSLRLFEILDRRVNSAFDTERDAAQGLEGAATASFIVSPPSGGAIDLPAHYAGPGLILDARGPDVRYEHVRT